MGAKDEFVTNERIWQRIEAALKDGGAARIAVPFIGLGASQWIKPAAGSWVVTRCDLRSAQAGQVSGKDLLVWHKRGVRIFNLQALHAKVFAFNGAAFIGSSNASVTSRDRLIEAGVWTSEKALAKSAWAFVEGSCNEEVDETFLKKLADAYRPPSQYPLHGENNKEPYDDLGTKTAQRKRDEAPLHLIRVYSRNWNDAQREAVKCAEEKGRKRLLKKFEAELSSFTWPGAPDRFALGDLVLARMTDKASGSETVQPWARVVGIHKVRGKNQQAVATATFSSWMEMPLSEFVLSTGGLMDNFLKRGGRSRLATPEERAMVLQIWRHKQAKLLAATNKASRA